MQGSELESLGFGVVLHFVIQSGSGEASNLARRSQQRSNVSKSAESPPIQLRAFLFSLQYLSRGRAKSHPEIFVPSKMPSQWFRCLGGAHVMRLRSSGVLCVASVIQINERWAIPGWGPSCLSMTLRTVTRLNVGGSRNAENPWRCSAIQRTAAPADESPGTDLPAARSLRVKGVFGAGSSLHSYSMQKNG